ncbi:MAG: hypothetical protein KC620_24505, partial [Myxococcales bacterium]|nr:hypothetical protein [Myxococcales bacterium]
MRRGSPVESAAMLRLFLILGTVLSTGPAVAAKRRVGLEYQAPASCPDEAALRRAVAAELGEDLVSADAALVVRVHIDADEALVATLRVVDANGTLQGERRLESPPGDCGELVRAVALSVAIALGPPPPVPTPARPPPPVELRWGLGPAFTLGTALAPSGGLAASVMVERAAWAAEVDLLVDGPLTLTEPTLQGGVVRSHFLGGGLRVCRALPFTLRPCLGGLAGQQVYIGEGYADPRQVESATVALA